MTNLFRNPTDTNVPGFKHIDSMMKLNSYNKKPAETTTIKDDKIQTDL